MKTLAIMILACCSLAAQVTVTDTIRTPVDNSLFVGSIVINAPQLSYGGVTYARAARKIRVTAGLFSAVLTPNIGAVPSGTSYSVVYVADEGPRWAETWVVPAAPTPTTIAAIRSTVPLPTTSISLSQIPLCTGSQIIKMVTGAWACAADATGVGGDYTASAVIDIISVSDGTCKLDSTAVTVTGAALGGRTTIGLSFLPPEGITMLPKVSGPNSVRVEVCNWSGAAYDPPSGTYYLGVSQ